MRINYIELHNCLTVHHTACTSAHIGSVLCPAIAAAANGFLSSGHRYLGEVVQITCKHGYAVVGPSQVSCMPGGTWSHPPSKCERKLPLCHVPACHCMSPISPWLQGISQVHQQLPIDFSRAESIMREPK